MVAFWQDTVWNLLAMLRFVGALLGGTLIPLSMFPGWGRTFAGFTPFPLVFSFPIRCFLGQVGADEWMHSMAMLGLWIAGLSLGVAVVWRRGTRTYSGVGI
jgi:ABC-2 type transport system permease protein